MPDPGKYPITDPNYSMFVVWHILAAFLRHKMEISYSMVIELWKGVIE